MMIIVFPMVLHENQLLSGTSKVMPLGLLIKLHGFPYLFTQLILDGPANASK